MTDTGSLALAAGGSMSALAALAHVACIVIGAPAYRVMGGGSGMAGAAPGVRLTVATLAIALVLAGWAAYAFSGAGVITQLPQTRLVLSLICAAYLGRALGFPFLEPLFPGNSRTFWIVSSTICALIGLVHLYGTYTLWRSP